MGSESLLVNHRGKVEEIIELKAEDEKQNNCKEIEKLDQEIGELNSKIRVIEEEKSRLNNLCAQKDEYILKFERKRKKLEKYIEVEMSRTREEGEKVSQPPIYMCQE